MIDIHTHIIPGIDDGPGDEATAIEMFRIAEIDGIKEIVVTPHIIPGVYDNKNKDISALTVHLNNLLISEDINIRIHTGAEHYMDDSLHRMIKEKSLCTINNQGKYVLVEFPMQEIPAYANELLFEIQLSGITPILAHPERNAGVAKNPAYLYELIYKGVLMQINASSLLGHFGHTVAQLAETMLRHDWVHFIASDAHSTGVRSPRLSEAAHKVKNIIGDKATDLVFNNPQKILTGATIEVGEVKTYQPPKGTFLKKLKNIF